MFSSFTPASSITHPPSCPPPPALPFPPPPPRMFAGMLVQRFGFRLERQLEMADDVLCVRVSPDGKLLAASLLDHTIKVYYTDRSVVKWVQHLKLLQPFCVVVCVVGSGG